MASLCLVALLIGLELTYRENRLDFVSKVKFNKWLRMEEIAEIAN